MVEHGKPPISAEELKRRGEALDHAVAANRLEGLRASPEVQAIVSVTADPHSERGEGRRILPCS